MIFAALRQPYRQLRSTIRTAQGVYGGLQSIIFRVKTIAEAEGNPDRQPTHYPSKDPGPRLKSPAGVTVVMETTGAFQTSWNEDA